MDQRLLPWSKVHLSHIGLRDGLAEKNVSADPKSTATSGRKGKALPLNYRETSEKLDGNIILCTGNPVSSDTVNGLEVPTKPSRVMGNSRLISLRKQKAYNVNKCLPKYSKEYDDVDKWEKA